MYKFFVVLFFSFLSFKAFSYDEPSIDEFYANKQNKEKYEQLVSSGVIMKVREQMLSICKKWSVDKDNLEDGCACATKEISKFTDRDLVYFSLIAYQRYSAKKAALEEGNPEEFERLKEMFSKSPLLPEKMEQKCSKR